MLPKSNRSHKSLPFDNQIKSNNSHKVSGLMENIHETKELEFFIVGLSNSVNSNWQKINYKRPCDCKNILIVDDEFFNIKTVEIV